MKYRWVLGVAATYVAAVMGAGFASGKEIYEFFTRYGLSGLFGTGLLSFFLAGLGIYLLIQAQACRSETYQELLQYLTGNAWAQWLDPLLGVTIVLGLPIVMSGGGAVAYMLFGIHTWLGTFVTAILMLMVLYADTRMFLRLNSYLVGIFFFIGGGISLLAIQKGAKYPLASLPHLPGWWLGTTLYVAYNMLSAFVVLGSIGGRLPSPKIAAWGGAVGGLALGLMAFLLGLANHFYYESIRDVPLPMVIIAGQSGPMMSMLYGLGLWLAMVTTGMGNVWILAERLRPITQEKTMNAILWIVLFMWPLAQFGLGTLIRVLYSGMGYLGAVIMLRIAYIQILRVRRRSA